MKSESASTPPTWLFARGGDQVRVQRVEPTRLVVSSPGEDDRYHDFDSVGALLDFQVAYEDQLFAGGWRLVEFSPERRRQDRRNVLRFGKDRRRRPSPLA